MASQISRRTSLVLTAGGALSLLAACAPSATPTATAPVAPPPTVVQIDRTPTAGAATSPTSAAAATAVPKDLVNLRLGLPTAAVQNDSVAWYLLGKERGFQREQGVDIELVPI